MLRSKVNVWARVTRAHCTRVLGWCWLGCALFAPSTVGCNHRDESTAQPAPADTTALQLTWPLLQRLGYRLVLESSSTMSMPGAPFKLELKAGVSLVPIEAKGGRTAILLRMVEPVLTFDAARTPESSALEAELTRPFWFALEQGRVVDSRVAQGLSPQAVSMLRTVISGLQLALPATPGQKTWQATELDSTGQYQTEYTASANGALVEKKKLRFKDTLIAGKANAQQRTTVLPEVLKSSARLELARGLLQKVTLEDELRSTLLGTNQVTVRNHLSLLRESGPAPVDARELTVPDELVALPPAQAYGSGSVRAQFDAMRAGDANFKDVLAALEQAEGAVHKHPIAASLNEQALGEDAQEAAKAELAQRTELLSSLMGLLRTKPETVELVRAAIARNSPAAGALADGLGMADTPASQGALAAVLQSPKLSRAQRLAYATSLIRVRTPSPETVAAVRGFIQDPLLQDHGVYGLGTLARRLRESGDAARSNALVDELLRGLANAATAQDRFRWLRGVANSAAPQALSALLPLLEDKAATVRQAAMDALRPLTDPRVDAAIRQRLASEPDVGVRRAIVRVAQRRTVTDTLETAVVTTAKSDHDPTVRAVALRTLEGWLPERASLRATVQSLQAASALVAAPGPEQGVR